MINNKEPIKLDLKIIGGPLVYHYFKDNQSYYIGSGSSIGRAFAGNHKKAKKCLNLICELEVIPCDTREEAYVLEKYLITKHQPILNSEKDRIPGPHVPNWKRKGRKTWYPEESIREHFERQKASNK